MTNLTELIEEPLLSTGDVGRLTGWSRQKVRALIATGKLPAVDTSSGERPRWSIRPADVKAMLSRPGKTAGCQQRIDVQS